MQKKERDLPHVCEACELAKEIGDDDNVLCKHHGVVARSNSCRKFTYDPLKRAPIAPRIPQIPDANELVI